MLVIDGSNGEIGHLKAQLVAKGYTHLWYWLWSRSV